MLYNWRVFPLHLDEPPVVGLQETDSRTSGKAALAQHLDSDKRTEQEQARGSGRELLQRKGNADQPGEQQGTEGNRDQCIAWPEDGGLPDGPVVYRYHLAGL